jgi:hypothetical protein
MDACSIPKKKSIKKKSPNKLSVKQSLLLQKLKLFYEPGDNLKQLLDIINNNSKISLRIIDWFVTNYSKKNYVVIPVLKASSHTIKQSKKKTMNMVCHDINVYLNYKAQLKAYSKKQFDPFCRRERISYKYSDNESITTTVGQLNFFKWAIDNDILVYIQANLKEIEDDMNLNIKKPTGTKKTLKGSPVVRKKRRELSMSSVKQMNRHGGNIVLNFD